MSDRITADGLRALQAALTLPIVGRVDTLPQTGATGVFAPLEDGRDGICMRVEGLPLCAVLKVDVYDSSDPPMYVWTVQVDRIIKEGEVLTVAIVAA